MKILVPATSANLGLGFNCLGLGLKFSNEAVVEKAKITSISINDEGSEDVFLKRSNALMRISNEIYGNLSGKKENFRFILQNNTPLLRGLGSSSAMIVGAIGTAYAISGLKIEKEHILNGVLKYENYPDNITPTTLGGFVCSMVKNGKVFNIREEFGEALRAIIVISSIAVNTGQNREALNLNVSLKDCVFNLSHPSFLMTCFLEKRCELLRLASQDKLYESKRMKTLPELSEVRKFAPENKALMNTFSGSGPSFSSLTFKEEAKHLATKMAQRSPTFCVEHVEFDDEGFKIC